MAYDQRNDRGGSYDQRSAPPRNYQNEFPNSGSLHMREKRSNNSPDMGGDFVISNEVLDYVLREAQNGAREVKLEASAWRRTAQRSNTTFLSLAINTPYSYRQQQQNPDYRDRGYGGGRGQTVPNRAPYPGQDERRGPPPRENDMFPGDQPSRGGYAEQSGGRERQQQGGRYPVDRVPRDEPSFMRDDPRQDRGRGGFSRELDDEIPF